MARDMIDPENPFEITYQQLLREKRERELPIVCLPLMRRPSTPERQTKYLPEMWKPSED